MDRFGISKSGVTILMVFALLLPASLAEARIVPQKGIMGINLNMTRARWSRRRDGRTPKESYRNEILGQQRVMRYGRTRVGFSGTRRSSRVVRVTTRTRRQRTPSGVGVGSTEAAVRAASAGSAAAPSSAPVTASREGSSLAERVTDFSLSSADGRPGDRCDRDRRLRRPAFDRPAAGEQLA